MARCAVGGWNAPRRPRQCTRHGVVLRSVSGVCGGGTHKCVLQPLQCWERSVAVSRHCGCARRALGADRDRDRTLCVDLMCGYRPVSCADGIAIYKPDPGDGVPDRTRSSRAATTRWSMRHVTDRTRRAAAATSSAIRSRRPAGRADCGGGTAEGRGELLDAARVRLSPLRSVDRATHT